jgi:hypothetical protein
VFIEVLIFATIVSLLAAPLVPQLLVPKPSATDTEAARHARRRRLNPVQAASVEAAIARVLCEAPELGGNTIQLPCRECGRRSIPPVEYVDSPIIPIERAGLVPLGPVGFVITATCSACDGPLISRVLTEEEADYARRLGAIDGEQLEASMADWLDTL